jgi:Domain of unknown function (DUF4440)
VAAEAAIDGTAIRLEAGGSAGPSAGEVLTRKLKGRDLVRMTEDELAALERQGWDALSTDGETARAFYDRVLDEQVVMLLPGGMVLDDRDTILDSMSGQPWSRYALEDVRSFRPASDIGVVTYGVVARRDDQQYSALMSSLYVRREDGWKLVFHQQTPR